MKIVTDHGFPKGSLPGDDPMSLFRNERDYVASTGKHKTTVAAMDWAYLQIETLTQQRDITVAALKKILEIAEAFAGRADKEPALQIARAVLADQQTTAAKEG